MLAVKPTLTTASFNRTDSQLVRLQISSVSRRSTTNPGRPIASQRQSITTSAPVPSIAALSADRDVARSLRSVMTTGAKRKVAKQRRVPVLVAHSRHAARSQGRTLRRAAVDDGGGREPFKTSPIGFRPGLFQDDIRSSACPRGLERCRNVDWIRGPGSRKTSPVERANGIRLWRRRDSMSTFGACGVWRRKLPLAHARVADPEQGNADTANHAETVLARAVALNFAPDYYLCGCKLYTNGLGGQTGPCVAASPGMTARGARCCTAATTGRCACRQVCTPRRRRCATTRWSARWHRRLRYDARRCRAQRGRKFAPHQGCCATRAGRAGGTGNGVAGAGGVPLARAGLAGAMPHLPAPEAGQPGLRPRAILDRRLRARRLECLRRCSPFVHVSSA